MILLALCLFQPILEQAIEDRAFPGAALALLQANQPPQIVCVGSTFYEEGHPITPDTLFDLASLTKVLATTTLAMQHLDLDDEAFEELTVRQLLSHRAGLPAEVPPTNREITISFLESPPRLFPPGTQKLYSDIGFILLGRFLEQRLQAPLDILFERHISQPLGLAHLCFNPLGKHFSLSDIAPTEIDHNYRHRLIWGTVHDETADILGGVAGHAGLFGSIRDVAVLFTWLLEQSELPTFAKEELGWQQTNWGADAPISTTRIGHLGFTGCSLWADLDRGVSVVLLTNRVHPSRENIAIRRVRSQLIQWLSF